MDMNRLARLYDGMENAQKQLARFERLKKEFENKFGSSDNTEIISAPGRTEIAGNHTDHNFGCVLAASVDLDTVAVARKTDNNIVTLYSEGYDKPFCVDVSDLSVHMDEKETTFALIRGVAACLKEEGYQVGGFEACVTSTVLSGSGLSSSAAFEVLLVAINDALYNGWTVPAELNAKISQRAENRYFLKPCGLMDQMASAVGGLVTIDFAGGDAKVEAISYDFSAKGYSLCVVSAGGDHGNLTNEYAAVPAEMKAVAKALGAEVLRDVVDKVEEEIPNLKGKVSDRSILRALHFVDENARVGDMVKALKNDDLPAFLRGIIESGESSWKLLQNLCVPGRENQEMMLALEMSKRMLSGKGGAWRIHGGGFAGTILAFVPKTMVNEYKEKMNAVFGENAVKSLYVRPEGAVWLK
ncbi:MAG: galactokinase [Clostridia bacterium]|nr:galactokinase [Clostridia bacterium]